MKFKKSGKIAKHIINIKINTNTKNKTIQTKHIVFK